MKERKIEIVVKEYGPGELPEEDRKLVEMARKASMGSYSPYSRFAVGAAILLDNGEIVTGANQENAAYPSGTCAERTAAFYASARYPGAKFVKLAVAARNVPGPYVSEKDYERSFQALPISPCGACRQALLEYENTDAPTEVILYGRERVMVFPSIASMLPYCFTEF